MAEPTTGIFFNSTTPAAPSGNQNVKPQSDGGTPLQSISMYPQMATSSLLGVVKPDGTTISVDDTGTISAASSVTPADIQQESFIYGADTGSANAYAITLSPTPTIVAGSIAVVKIANGNTGPSTLTVNGGSATAITKNGDEPLAGGELVAGQIAQLIFDGTEWQLASGTVNTNPVQASFIQGTTAYTDSSATLDIAFGANNAGGNCLIVDFLILEPYGGAGTLSIADTQGNTWVTVVSEEQNNVLAVTFVALDCKAGANTVEITYSDGSGYAMLGAIHEYSGVAAVGAVDASTYGQASTVGTLPIGLTLTTSAASDLLHLFSSCDGTAAATLTQSGGYAARESAMGTGSGLQPQLFTFDLLAGAAGSYSNSVNYSGTAPTYIAGYLLALKGSPPPVVADAITALTGDVTATGPGSVAASVVKVNGAAVPVSQGVLGSNSSGQLIAGSPSGITLQVNGTNNGSQSKLNLVAGTSVTLSDDGSGDITIAASGAGGSYQPSALTVPPALSSFTWVNQGSSSAANSGSAIAMTIADSSSLNWRALVQAVPGATPYSKAAFWKSLQYTSSSQVAGIYFYDGTKLLGLEFLTQNSGAIAMRVERITNVNTDGSTVYSSSLTYNSTGGSLLPNPFTGGFYGRMRNDGTNLYIDTSLDGANWINLYSEAVGAFITPTYHGFGGCSVTSGAQANCVISLQGWQ